MAGLVPQSGSAKGRHSIDVLLAHIPDAPVRAIDVPRAEIVGALAERVFAAGLAVAPHALRPVYVRRPDAELARDRAAAVSGRA